MLPKLSVEQGEYVAIMGESGSGKTTLLNILAALDKPTEGNVILDGNNLSKLKESQISAFRRDNLGFVFQDFNLLYTEIYILQCLNLIAAEAGGIYFFQSIFFKYCHGIKYLL